MRRARAAGAAVAVAVLGVLLQWVPAGAQPAGPKLALLAITPFMAAGDTEFELTLGITGTPATVPLAVTVERFDEVSNRADPRAQLDAWISGRREVPSTVPAPNRESVFSTELGDAGGTVTVPVSTAASSQSNRFVLTDAGVFPLVVRLHTRDGRTLLDTVRTFLIRLPTPARDQPPLRVAPILGLRAPVALRPDGRRQLGDNDSTRLQAAQSLLRKHAGVPLTVDPQPETMAALNPGTTSLNSATLLAAIGNRPILSSTYVDIDVSRFVDAGLRDQVERQRQIGLHALTSSFDRTETAFDTGTFLARHPLSADARAALQTSQPGSVTQLVVESRGIGPVDQRTPAGPDADLQPFSLTHAAGGRSLAVLWDERLSGRLTATGNPVADAQAALADLTVLACGRTSPPPTPNRAHCNALPPAARGIALVVPDETDAVRAFDRLLDMLASRSTQRAIELTQLQGLFAVTRAATSRSAEPVVRSADAAPAGADLTGYAARLSEIGGRVGAFTSMLAAPQLPPGEPGGATTSTTAAPTTPSGEPVDELDDHLVQLLDVSGAGAPADSAVYLDEVARRLDGIFSAVRVPVQRAITLTDSSGEVPVAVENQLRYPVTVRIQLSSDKPVFDDRRTTWVERQLPAATDAGPSASLVSVPVRGVTSGVSTIEVRVSSPDNAVVLGSTRIEVRSTAVSWVGLVLTVAAGVFLVVWWARHFRDARRARKLVDVEDVDEAVAMATGEVPVVGNAAAGPRV